MLLLPYPPQKKVVFKEEHNIASSITNNELNTFYWEITIICRIIPSKSLLKLSTSYLATNLTSLITV